MILLVVLYALLIFVSSGQDIANNYEEPFAADVRVFGCKSPEYVKINSDPGIIHCTFPPSFKAVFWYDDVFKNNTGLPVVRYDSISGRTSGEGYIKGDYDVMTNGSLVIKKVTLEHDKSFKVICIEGNDDVKVYTSSVVVLVESPASQLFIGTCSGPICYQQLTATTHLNCFFNGTKPARHLSWQSNYLYSHNKRTFQSKIVENANGTFNSIATLELSRSNTNLLSYWVCKAYWIHPNDNRNIEILVDFSDYDSIKSRHIAQNTTAEIAKPHKLRCGSGYQLNIWKKIKDGTAILIGLQVFGSVIKNEVYNDISFTNTGDIEFPSVKVTHEGLYICLYSEGTTVKIKHVYLEVLVPPTPPHVVIKGCERNAECTVTRTAASLECSVFGVRPLMNITWYFNQNLPIKLENYKETVSSHDDIFDITSKVDYLMSGTFFCDEEVVLTCVASGPTSKIFQYSKEVKIKLESECVDRASCSCDFLQTYCENTRIAEEGTQITTAVIILTIIVVIETFVLVALGVWKFCDIYTKKKHLRNQTTLQYAEKEDNRSGTPFN